MTDGEITSLPLIDLLPPGEWFYEDRASEANLIEDLRLGRLSIVVSLAAEVFEDLLRTRLGGKADLTYADWAELRYYLQIRAHDYLLSLAMDDFPIRDHTRSALVTGMGAAGEAVNMRQTYDAALAREEQAAQAAIQEKRRLFPSAYTEGGEI